MVLSHGQCIVVSRMRAKEIKPERERAQHIGSRMILYKDALAKGQLGNNTIESLQVVLSEASIDPIAAEQELLMAWRYYTQERELQIAYGEFRFCSSPEEIEAARRFSQSKTIVYDPSNVRGVSFLRSRILETIDQDTKEDAIRWQTSQASDAELKEKFTTEWQPNRAQELDSEKEAHERTKYAEKCLRWFKSKSEEEFRKKYGNILEYEVLRMLNEHRDYWAQHPTESYDSNALNHIFDFSLYGGNYGLGTLYRAWDRYLESRIDVHQRHRVEPFASSSDEERSLIQDERRKLPIDWPHSHPNAREIIEAHIITYIEEDIAADIPKWERYNSELQRRKKKAEEIRIKSRIERIQNHREAFVSKVRDKYGHGLLQIISETDIERYAVDIVDNRVAEEDIWYSILQKYDFDQNTNSCLYFIRQGNAIKIGITDQLERRFSQIKTSAAETCKIENVVYTHHGRKLERKLHQALMAYNSHLEWFALPPKIEDTLFAAKSAADIEAILETINQGDLDDFVAQT